MAKRSLLLALFLFTVTAGCGGQRESDNAMAPSTTQAPLQEEKGSANRQSGPAPTPTDQSGYDGTSGYGAPGSGGGKVSLDAAAERKIIRNGEIELRVTSVDRTRDSLGTLATALGGWVANTSMQGNVGSTVSGSVQLRIPSTAFDKAVAAVRGMGEIQLERTTTADVTEEFVDLSARLKTQRELEARLLKLLNERTGKLSDIVEIETELASVREEIESMEGRLRVLNDRVGYSTLDVRLYEPGAIGTSETETFGGRIADAFRRGLDGLVSVIEGLITLLVALIPFILLGAGLLFLLRPMIRRARARRRARVGEGAMGRAGEGEKR